MAFQVPIPWPVRNFRLFHQHRSSLTAMRRLQNVAAVTSDLWPSMSSLLAAPWKQAGRAPMAGVRDTRQRDLKQENTVVVSIGFCVYE